MPVVCSEVPDEWVKAANEMDVSLAEYTRRMVRAGRRQFGYEQSIETSEPKHTLDTDSRESGDVVKSFVERNLSAETGSDEDDLVELIEDDIAMAADELCEEGKAKYRRSEGGWIKVITDG